MDALRLYGTPSPARRDASVPSIGSSTSTRGRRGGRSSLYESPAPNLHPMWLRSQPQRREDDDGMDATDNAEQVRD
jgi:hypothetical protein